MSNYRLRLSKHPEGTLIEKQYKFLWWWRWAMLDDNTIMITTNDPMEVNKWKAEAVMNEWSVIDETESETDKK